MPTLCISKKLEMHLPIYRQFWVLANRISIRKMFSFLEDSI